MTNKYKTSGTVGWVLIVIGIVGGFGALNIGTMLTGIFIFILPGAYLVNRRSKVKKQAQKYASYYNLVVNRRETSIAKIATTLNLEKNVVTDDLVEMINLRYFGNAYIDSTKNEIILNGNEKVEDVQYIVVNCLNCSASNKIIVGTVGECEYCGSKLQG